MKKIKTFVVPFAVLLLLWQVLAATGVFPKSLFPGPADVYEALAELTQKTLGQIRKQAEACKRSYSQAACGIMNCRIDGEEKKLEISLKEYEKMCEPLPEKISRNRQSHRYGCNILNSVSLILSVVGRVSVPGIVLRGILFALPAITLILL